MIAYLTSAYLPPIQYISKLLSHDSSFIEVCDNYVKQTYRNRCVIDSPNGPLSLTVPIVKAADGGKQQMRDVQVSYHLDWQHQHWQAFEATYYNSPFFEYYQDDFRPFYERKWKYLIDLNEALLDKCCELMDVQPSKARTTEYKADFEPCERDYRMSISPKVDFRTDKDFVANPYYQVFQHKHGFIPNLSIFDLLMNMGNESILIL